MNNQTHKIYQFLELDRNGWAKYVVIDIYLDQPIQVLFSQKAKIFSSFNQIDHEFNPNELSKLTQFLATSLKRFVTIFPVYKSQVKKINLLIPNEVINYEAKTVTFSLEPHDAEQINLTTTLVQNQWNMFVKEYQQQINQTHEQVAIDCSCLGVKVNNHWSKTPINEQVLVSDDISFVSEWQHVKSTWFKPLLKAINQVELAIGKVNALSKINCNPQLNNWLYDYQSLVVEWGESETWVKYYNGEGTLIHEKMAWGIKDLYQRIANDLTLDPNKDLACLINVVKNYADLTTFDSKTKDFSVLRTRNNKALITTYTMKQVLKVLTKNLDEMLMNIKDTIAFKLGINPAGVDYQIHCGLIEQIPEIEVYLGSKHLKFLTLAKLKVDGNYGVDFNNLYNWALIIQEQENSKIQGMNLDQPLDSETSYPIPSPAKPQIQDVVGANEHK
ncbi:hypothetical protein LD125_00224 [Mesoplasma sp. JKS002658]|uniref:hypothetical protein n=1 Tax=Mesoplasma whartonense TaxID=2878854 RepID=UPI002022A8F1|nr:MULTISPECIES: hypothetical protein [unclassified Mesoplasma]MCL8211265.1 hypothetical protein [Mesoplasma sp. JKS002664]MCL8211926.1 hypothetical protein [Mesoplasma sp. JKS002662]MCL8212841.1 hypothetical protein [Mesoplasma sp. JKS002661]MCL8213090.1 hypothetical protein [Mesoplasma sp. JKS002660]MCL8213969.1 hypothetical protein [Mesoplasma sp. JKS002658]